MKKKIAFISGNFNIIHAGHIRLFKFARSLAENLIIGLYSDKLSNFKTIQLKDMDLVKLLNRKDTKFVFHNSKIDHLLEKLSSTYKLLQINDMNTFTYHNTYFDTEDNLFYNQHHNEKRNRFKVRFRQYSGTDDCYFEIKTKNNKNRTIKKRLKVEKNTENLG